MKRSTWFAMPRRILLSGGTTATILATGQWRALDLPNALRGKIQPTQVYSIDPAVGNSGRRVRRVIPIVVCQADLTVVPYAIANNLPLQSGRQRPVCCPEPSAPLSTAASDFFFTGGTFSNQTPAGRVGTRSHPTNRKCAAHELSRQRPTTGTQLA